ncbi:hypothetical protein [Phenylobacterium aquaticum]|nr:hypothetical protein [Phenylobacterium aquaticum]
MASDGDGGRRVTWITDVLPDVLAGHIEAPMSAAVPIMTATPGRVS